ncbi:DNA polymerase beta superfamily protein [Brevundimonas sp. GCM10030266]|uniref:nucleotidyltransferase domain-containing protein n=1 Tax=Brevundimonas sp. GCM10030266 TaxID=3273386 RepID=UPI00361A180E
MTIRNIPDDMAPEAVAQVDAILATIRREEGVHIPLAVESGSRAWGFPSPDSDYDGRFLYVRPARQALTIWPRRDVIETPLVGDMDVNGWDLSKALRLLLKGNAVVVEWLQSPILYTAEPWFRDELLAFADQWLDRDMVLTHYLHLGRRQKVLYLDDQSAVSLKKVFYVLRPAVALRWLRLHPDKAVAPMHLPTLMAECDPPGDLVETVEELRALKAMTREMGKGTMPPSILSFIETEFAAADPGERSFIPRSADAERAADELFARVTLRLDGLSPG